MSYTTNHKPENKLDNKDFHIVPIITRLEPYKVDDDVDFEENSPIVSDTIEDLRNKLQVMINNNNDDSSNKRMSKKSYSRRSRLSTSTTSTSSYFSARINSDISSSRDSLYQHSNVINDDHMKSHKISSHSSIAFDDDDNIVNNRNSIKEHPSNWNVNQVCQWLSENGFNSETEKFIENDITGDILLGLDLVALKEININSFGKRVHILNTIALLKDHYSNDLDKVGKFY
jgi:hypothetical protein